MVKEYDYTRWALKTLAIEKIEHKLFKKKVSDCSIEHLLIQQRITIGKEYRLLYDEIHY